MFGHLTGLRLAALVACLTMGLVTSVRADLPVEFTDVGALREACAQGPQSSRLYDCDCFAETAARVRAAEVETWRAQTSLDGIVADYASLLETVCANQSGSERRSMPRPETLSRRERRQATLEFRRNQARYCAEDFSITPAGEAAIQARAADSFVPPPTRSGTVERDDAVAACRNRETAQGWFRSECARQLMQTHSAVSWSLMCQCQARLYAEQWVSRGRVTGRRVLTTCIQEAREPVDTPTDRGECPAAGAGDWAEADPEPVFAGSPRFPPAVYRQGLSGAVTIEYVIDEIGLVYGVRIIESSNEIFNSAVIETFQVHRYNPQTIVGDTVPRERPCVRETVTVSAAPQ